MGNSFVKFTIILLWLLVVPDISVLAKATLTDAEALVSGYLKDTHSYTARFHQRVINISQAHTENSSGVMAFTRPDKFSWHYEKPYMQQIISDGRTLWVFDRELDQVTMRSGSEILQGTPIMLLNQPQDLGRRFHTELLLQQGTEVEIKLTSKDEDPAYEYITLLFDNGILQAMEIYDSFDHYSSISFSEIQHNPDLADDWFYFEPPEGVDVIDASRSFE